MVKPKSKYGERFVKVMTKEEKQLLFQDLCARLPYGVKVQYKGNRYDLTEMHKDGRTYLGSYNSIYGDWHCSLEFEDYPKPYLRPMSSMTEEEKREYVSFIGGQKPFDSDYSAYPKEHKYVYEWDVTNYVNWLNSHHFDYRGLIEKGLANEVTEENNPYKD